MSMLLLEWRIEGSGAITKFWKCTHEKLKAPLVEGKSGSDAREYCLYTLFYCNELWVLDVLFDEDLRVYESSLLTLHGCRRSREAPARARTGHPYNDPDFMAKMWDQMSRCMVLNSINLSSCPFRCDRAFSPQQCRILSGSCPIWRA